MTDYTHLDQNHPNWNWRRVARIAFPIARRLIKHAIGENDATPQVESIGPIEYDKDEKRYRNNADTQIALFFSSVDNQGHISENSIDRIIFDAHSQKEESEVSQLLRKNLVGNISWSVVGSSNENGESDKAFVELTHWNGQEIALFDLDDVPENDLHVKMGFQGNCMCMTASNSTIQYSYELEIILIDASGNVANFDISIPASSGSQTISMGPDFNSNLPLQRAFFIGKTKKVDA